MIKTFNTNYFNAEYFTNHQHGKMHLDFEENRLPYHRLFDEVVEFCYYNDVPKSTGLSVLDIYNYFDYGMFTLLRDYLVKENNKKVKHLTDLQNQMDAKQSKILKGK